MKICLLKQVVCNDLYVCSITEKYIKNILSTSQMRSGITISTPVGPETAQVAVIWTPGKAASGTRSR